MQLQWYSLWELLNSISRSLRKEFKIICFCRLKISVLFSILPLKSKTIITWNPKLKYQLEECLPLRETLDVNTYFSQSLNFSLVVQNSWHSTLSHSLWAHLTWSLCNVQVWGSMYHNFSSWEPGTDMQMPEEKVCIPGIGSCEG